LSLQTYLVATGYSVDVKVDRVGDQKKITSFQIIDPTQEPEKVVQNLPVDSQGRLLVNYYGPQNTLPYVSAKDIFSDSPYIEVSRYSHKTDSGVAHKVDLVKKAEFFKNKTAILGVTSVAVYDLRNTPVAANFPGPEIHLTLLANLFENNFLKRLPHEEVILPTLILLIGLGLTAILTFVGAFRTVVCLSATLIIGFVIDKFVFEKLNYIVSSFFFFFLIVGVHFSMLFYKYFSE